MKLPPVSCAYKDCVPYMRYGHSASAIGDVVYIFGGRNDTHGACNILYCFDTGEAITTWNITKNQKRKVSLSLTVVVVHVFDRMAISLGLYVHVSVIVKN